MAYPKMRRMSDARRGRGADADGVSSPFRAFRVFNFRLYYVGSVLGYVGFWTQSIAQDWLVLELTGSGTALGLVTALQLGPGLVLSPYAGLAADRMSKRMLTTLAQAVMAGTALVLGLLTLGGAVRIWHVYAAAVVFGVAFAFYAPTRQALVAEVVGVGLLPSAVGMASAAFYLGQLLGPAFAGLLIHWYGTGPAFLVNAATGVGAILTVALMRAADLRPAPPAAAGSGPLRDGLRGLWDRPEARFALTVTLFAWTFGLSYQLTMVLMATREFGRGAGAYALLATLLAAGAVVGAVRSATREETRPAVLACGALGFAAVQLGGALTPTYLMFAALVPAAGFAWVTMVTAATTIVQTAAPPDRRGRVLALYMAMLTGAALVGSPAVGWVGETAGPRMALVLGGFAVLAGTALAYSRRPAEATAT